MSLEISDIEKARERVKAYAQRTPLLRSGPIQKRLALTGAVFLKLENLQNTGAFKVRGAANKIVALCEAGQKPERVIAASAGNHAQAVAFVAGQLGIPATIVMPEGSPLVKVAATEGFGAEVVLHGLIYDDAFEKAQELMKEIPGAVYVHAYEDLLVMAGQGTMGLEIDEDLLAAGVAADEELQIVVPVGGGGLMSGVATAIKARRPGAKIFGVVCEAAPDMAESFRSGKIVQTTVARDRSRTIGEGLAVKKVSKLSFSILNKLVDEMTIVSDDEMARAMVALLESSKLVIEGSGAAGIAAVLAGKFTKWNPKLPTVFVLCGGNVDLNTMANIIRRGLENDGRWVHLQAVVEDKPGELARFAAAIAKKGANILEVEHDRISARSRVGYTALRCLAEARGRAHAQSLIDYLKEVGYNVEVFTT